MGAFGIVVVSRDSVWTERLRSAAALLRATCLCVRDWRLLGEPAVSGIAVVDGEAQEARELGRRFPRACLVLAARGSELSAERIAAALAGGVDGFLAKEDSAAVLAARLRGLLGRGARARRQAELVSPEGSMRFNGALGRLEVKSRSGWRPGPVIGVKESALLEMFFRHPGGVLERAVLLDAVWGRRALQVNPETLDKCVASLRRKLGGRGRALRTVRGKGYLWQAGA
ncbi:MAG: winged helix-turn-helix domain-containing protein [Elusimicrobia bacterium]|nr:winged helix-turn-helix domain-containing protein [Elusimicrobiota bacterium]